VTSYVEQMRFPRERTKLFNLHAAHTKSPDGRKAYLRLVKVEAALAEKNELLAKLALERELTPTTLPPPADSREAKGSGAMVQSHS
jgi:phytoene/squalene synthetase